MNRKTIPELRTAHGRTAEHAGAMGIAVPPGFVAMAATTSMAGRRPARLVTAANRLSLLGAGLSVSGSRVIFVGRRLRVLHHLPIASSRRAPLLVPFTAFRRASLRHSPRKRSPGCLDVGVHLALERLDALELALLAEPLEKAHGDIAPVDVLGEVE